MKVSKLQTIKEKRKEFLIIQEAYNKLDSIWWDNDKQNRKEKDKAITIVWDLLDRKELELYKLEKEYIKTM